MPTIYLDITKFIVYFNPLKGALPPEAVFKIPQRLVDWIDAEFPPPRSRFFVGDESSEFPVEVDHQRHAQS